MLPNSFLYNYKTCYLLTLLYYGFCKFDYITLINFILFFVLLNYMKESSINSTNKNFPFLFAFKILKKLAGSLHLATDNNTVGAPL